MNTILSCSTLSCYKFYWWCVGLYQENDKNSTNQCSVADMLTVDNPSQESNRENLIVAVTKIYTCDYRVRTAGNHEA